MSTFLKAVGILLIMSGIGLFLLTTSSAAEVGSRPVRNQSQEIGRNIGVGIGWSSISCISLILFVSGVFTWWAGQNAGKSSTKDSPRGERPESTPEPASDVPSSRKHEKREPTTEQQYVGRPIVVEGGRQSVKKIIFGWTLFLYAMYAALHWYSWTDCDDHSNFLTLFPVRQIYFVRAVEEKWTVSNGLIQKMHFALDVGEDETTVMHLVKAQIEASENLNIRSGPSVTYRKVDMLEKGEYAQVIGRNASGTWLKLGSGWVFTKYVNSNDDLMSLPVMG